jgi:ribose transport system ATP-binding protein
MTSSILEMRGIEKQFVGVQALRNVSFTVTKGSVHGLIGENGAGKSTLMRILSGAHRADAGEVIVDGDHIANPTPEKMLRLGIAVIYQELAQAPHLSVTENIFLGRLPLLPSRLVDWTKARKLAAEALAQLGFKVDPSARIDTLSVAQRQMVEIAKAISRDARIVVLDEPSAVLGDAELADLFAIIRRLSKERGISFIYISHRLKELHEICDQVTVLRDGAVVTSQPLENTRPSDLIRFMVGRELADIFPKRAPKLGDIRLSVKGLKRHGVLHDIHLELRRGEILGVCGLAGSGRTELLRAISGADPIDGGEIWVDGTLTVIASPGTALGLGIGLLPEDRKTEGLFLNQTVSFNISIASLRAICRAFLIARWRESELVKRFIEGLRIKTPSGDTKIMNLSGGNQQKCSLARQLAAGTKILLVDEPTRGVDVAAKREIYELLTELTTRNQASVLMVSSELPEIIGMCDRIIVMRDGAIAATIDGRSASEEAIMAHAVLH